MSRLNLIRRAISKGWPVRGLVFVGVLGATLLLLLRDYFFGNHAFAFHDIGNDTFVSYFADQVLLSRELHQALTISWSFSVGAGAYLGTFADGIALAGAALFPPDMQLSLRVYEFALRVMISGGFMYLYFRRIGTGFTAACIGGWAYALSGYMVTNGQWDDQGTMVAILAILLYSIEACLATGVTGWLVFCGVCVGVAGSYNIYLVAFSATGYLLVRAVAIDGKRFVFSAIASGWYCVIPLSMGLLLVAPILFPSIYYLFDSPRVTGQSSESSGLIRELFTTASLSQVGVQLVSFFHKDIFGGALAWRGIINWFEAPTFYVGVLPLILFPSALSKRVPKSVRRLAWTSLLIIAVYIAIPGVKYAAYAFQHGGYRYSTLLISLLILVPSILALSSSLKHGFNLGWVLFGGVCVVGLALVALLFRPAIVDVHVVHRVVCFTAIYVALLLAIRWAPKFALPGGLLIALACVIELGLSANPDINARTPAASYAVQVANKANYWDATGEALSVINAEESSGNFFRIEKTYNSVFLNDAMVQGYRGIKTYFLTGRSLNDLNAGFDVARPFPAANYISSYIDRVGLLRLLSVKYVLSKDGKGIPEGFRFWKSVDGIGIYRSDKSWKGLRLFDRVVSQHSVLNLPPSAREELTGRTAFVQDSYLPHVLAGGVREVEPREVSAGQGYDGNLSFLSENALRAKILAKSPSVAVFSIPFDKGWTIRVDGQVVDAMPVDFGLLGIVLPKGPALIELNYNPPGRAIGWLASLLTLIVLSAYGWTVRKRVKRPRFSESPGSRGG